MVSEVYISWLVLLGLLVISYFDVKKKSIPSPLTTSLLFVTSIVRFDFLGFGILGFIFGLLMMEGLTENGEFFSGLADLKMVVVVSLLLSSLLGFLVMCSLFLVVGIAYKIFALMVLKKKKNVELMPVFVIVFLLLAGAGLIKIW